MLLLLFKFHVYIYFLVNTSTCTQKSSCTSLSMNHDGHTASEFLNSSCEGKVGRTKGSVINYGGGGGAQNGIGGGGAYEVFFLGGGAENV